MRGFLLWVVKDKRGHVRALSDLKEPAGQRETKDRASQHWAQSGQK